MLSLCSALTKGFWGVHCVEVMHNEPLLMLGATQERADPSQIDPPESIERVFAFGPFSCLIVLVKHFVT